MRTIADVIAEEVTIIEHKELEGYDKLFAILETPVNFVEEIVDNTVGRNAETMINAGRKIKRRMRSWWW